MLNCHSGTKTLSLCIGISGGHHESVVFATDKEGFAVACEHGEGLNLHTYNYRLVIDRLDSLLDKLVRRLRVDRKGLIDQTARLVLAMPGAATEEDQALAEICLRRNGWTDESKYEIVDDTWAGLFAGTGTYRGVCAFAGTGASVFVGLGRLTGRPNKIDGWGPILGDFGSGFQLATDMFRFFSRSYDRGRTPPLFQEVVRQYPKIRSIHNVIRWFDTLHISHPRSWRIDFAETAKVAVQAADSPGPDPDAVRLVSAAAADMAESIELAFEGCKPDCEGLQIVFQGGMFQHSALYRNEVARRVRDLTNDKVGMSAIRPVVGAALMAVAGKEATSDPSTIDTMSESIRKLRHEEQTRLLTSVQQADSVS